ncbi:HD domain-containing protein [Bacillus pinisoli]|uniref:HD domain-containing protein n=1 Tax=Bacillus pinisoli TaxID=2901866 RepID=UPI001FF41C67|nr:HD domain-containing protein [Bacillus pinisoli]
MNEIIIQTKEFVKNKLEKDSSGHDWWHIVRVFNTAKELAKSEDADLFIVEMAALLHDIADEKLNESEEIGLQIVSDWLEKCELEPEVTQQILYIIKNMSFKGGNQSPLTTIEGQIVQDADRLDAIGAIGIARTFAYAGTKGDILHDPHLPVRVNMTKEEYRTGKSTPINHFYEKLLKLKDLMNTESAKKVAAQRHEYMEEFLNQFMKEWNGQA